MKCSFASFVFVLAAFARTAAPVTNPDKPKPTESPKPQYGSWGFDSAGADMAKKAGDDFFRFANGAWLDRVQIPGDKPAYSLRLAMTDTTEQRLHDLIEEAAKKAEQKPGDDGGQGRRVLQVVHG